MKKQPDGGNVYLDQVIQQQKAVEQELRRRAPVARPEHELLPGTLPPPPGSEEVGRGVDYRITGFWRWRNVIVPPNVYVVHTRRGHDRPLHIGLGISFRFNPYTDSFIVVPAAVQTIIINANCICRERQGILVQAYVQWIIDDIETAYRKLDFSDPSDPMRIVNIQLREQAEAAIKDKVATMSIDEVLSDKQPIIEELTHRLRAVAEGTQNGDPSSGLGLKIVTVQIKEAVVSSARLWENLQKPFRAERAKLARLAELEAQREIAARELENRRLREIEEMKVEDELATLRAEAERARYDREQAEKARRHRLEQEMERQAIAERNATIQARKEAELATALKELELERQRARQEIDTLRSLIELEKVKAERTMEAAMGEVAEQNLRHRAEAGRTEREIALFKEHRKVANDLSEAHVRSQLIAILPQIAAQMPTPKQVRTTIISGNGQDGTWTSLLGFVKAFLSLFEQDKD